VVLDTARGNVRGDGAVVGALVACMLTSRSRACVRVGLGASNFGDNEFEGTLPSFEGAAKWAPKLRVVSFADNRLVGTIPSRLAGLVTLEQLVLRNNRLNGTVPSDLGQQFYSREAAGQALSYYRSLTLVDVSLNADLTGSIPDAMLSLPSLQVLAFEGNLRMRAPENSSAYAGFRPTNVFFEWNNTLLCPQLRGPRVLLMSPPYLNYLGCICKSGYGEPPFECEPCPRHALCSQNETVWAIGFYPQCRQPADTTNTKASDMWHATLGPCYFGAPLSAFANVIPCPSRRCNPLGTCAFVAGEGLNCTSVCTQGYTGRLCTDCDPGYYSIESLCRECPPSGSSSWIWWSVTAAVLWLVVVLTSASSSIVLSTISTMSVRGTTKTYLS